MDELAQQEPAEDYEEQEWDAILRQPHVQRGLSDLAAKIRQRIADGEIEEGGFALE
jgi:hypothetical protein